jgi:hypothetical protein
VEHVERMRNRMQLLKKEVSATVAIVADLKEDVDW